MYKRINHYKFYWSEKTMEIMPSKEFCIIFWPIKILTRKQNTETFFQRELLLYVLLRIINFMSNF